MGHCPRREAVAFTAPVPGPVLIARASAFLQYDRMFFVYLDDFGHVGPYFDKDHPQFNTSPVFGFAGFAIPETQIRSFSSFFLQLKSNVCKADLETCEKPAFRWEKKGTNLFTKKSIEKYPSVRQAGFRVIDEIRQRGGFIFYYGREKIKYVSDLRAVGLQTTIGQQGSVSE
jgi:hypothetical protein